MRKKSFKELVKENKTSILKDKKILDNIYKKIEDRKSNMQS